MLMSLFLTLTNSGTIWSNAKLMYPIYIWLAKVRSCFRISKKSELIGGFEMSTSFLFNAIYTTSIYHHTSVRISNTSFPEVISVALPLLFSFELLPIGQVAMTTPSVLRLCGCGMPCRCKDVPVLLWMSLGGEQEIMISPLNGHVLSMYMSVCIQIDISIYYISAMEVNIVIVWIMPTN